MMIYVDFVFRMPAHSVLGVGVAGLLLVACGRSGLLDYQYGEAGVAGDDGGSSDSQVNDGTLDSADSADAPNLFPDAEPGPDAPGPCNAATCNGCCDGDTCVTMTSADQCGSEGMACVKCQPNENCKGGCFRPQSNCGPSNCQGCCLGDNDCASGLDDVACGTAGQQ